MIRNFCLMFLIFVCFPLYGKVYDCFLFFNEWELLEIRLHELDPVVDFFVLVEAKETFKGNPKPLYFDLIKKRFEQFAHKLIHVTIDEHILTSSTWEREAYQRNQMMRGLTHSDEEDIILISDIDEIVRAEVVPIIVDKLNKEKEGDEIKAVVCEQPFYRWYLNRYDPTPWKGTVATKYKVLKGRTPDSLRGFRDHLESLPKAGWHFTSMGGYERYISKILAFSHSQAENESPLPESLDAFYRNILINTNLVPIDESFPAYIRENIDYFSFLHLIDFRN